MFQIYGKSTRADKFVKYGIMTKVIDFVLYIDTFEHQCVVIEGILQSPRLKYHVETIGIRKLLRNSALFEHRCLQNIRNLYKHAGKCDNKQQFKYILEAAMVSIPEEFTNNIPISPMNLTSVKKQSSEKSLCVFTNILYVKNKTDICQVRDSK